MMIIKNKIIKKQKKEFLWHSMWHLLDKIKKLEKSYEIDKGRFNMKNRFREGK